jgi:competence protein ComEC
MWKSVLGMSGWLRRFVTWHPLFAVAVAVVICVLAADVHPWWGCAAGAAVALSGFLTGGWRLGFAWGFCGWLAVGVYDCREGSQRAAERELSGSPGRLAKARVLKDARGEHYWVAPAELLDGGHAGEIVWWEGRGKPPVAGAVITARGDFMPLPEARNPGEFDRKAWLRSQGVVAVFHAGKLEGGMETGRWATWGAAIRHGFRERVTAGLLPDSREAAVIRAVVIGEQPPDADALIAAFRNSGTLHAFSVSGLHVAMVGSIGWLLLGWLGVPRRWAVVALLPLIFGYSWITGNSAPAVRSAWMAAVFLGAFAFRRKPDLLNALGAVLLAALLWDGRLLFMPGVQLSYGVVAAIAVGTSWAARTFAWMETPELYLPEIKMTRWQKYWLHWRRKTAQSLSVSLAAGVGSAPLTAYHFGLITPVSVLAGLVLIPLVFVLLVAALIAVVLSPLPPVSRFVNRFNGHVANASVVSAEFFSAIPGGHWQLGRETRPVLLIYDFDHGAGASVFSSGSDGAVLIDCADAQSFKNRLLPSLRRLGIEPDSVVLSHPDGGHLGGPPQVWNSLPIRQALMPVNLSRSPAFRTWMTDAPNAGIRLHHAASIGSLPFPDGASLEILHAPDANAQNSVADARVALYLLHWHGWKILFTSDAGMGTEMKALASEKDFSADVIIAGCHRTDLSLCDAFLDAVHPQAIIASNARFPLSERRDPATLAYWKSRGIQVVDQAESGGVALRVDDSGNLCIGGFLSKSPVILNAR